MGSLNKVTLIGKLGADPEYNGSVGAGLCKLRVATSETWKDKQGNRQERTEWHNITAWAKTAELCRDYLSKGRQVYIEGRLQSREYTDKTGANRKAWEINADSVVFLGSRSDDEGSRPRQTQGNQQGNNWQSNGQQGNNWQSTNQNSNRGSGSNSDSEIPF